MKRIFALFLIAALFLAGPAATCMTASAAGVSSYITVKGFDPKTDYMRAMNQALNDGSHYAMQMGAIYEQQRNLKIDSLDLPQKKTSYFTDYNTAEEIKAAMQAEKQAAKKAAAYTEDELDLLSRIICAEAGSSWIPDWVQQMVGSVVLNRVKSGAFPNTIRDVIYQPGQYSPTWNGAINNTPDDRTVANARYVLEHGSVCPDNVVYQSTMRAGSGIYQSYYDSVLGCTEYFCYQ